MMNWNILWPDLPQELTSASWEPDVVNRSFPWNNYNYKEVQGYILLTQRPALMSRKFKPLTLSKLPHLCGPSLWNGMIILTLSGSGETVIAPYVIAPTQPPTQGQDSLPAPQSWPPSPLSLQPRKAQKHLEELWLWVRRGLMWNKGRCEPKTVDVGSVL